MESYASVAAAIAQYLAALPHPTGDIGDAAARLLCAVHGAVPRPGFRADGAHDHGALLADALAIAPANAIVQALGALAVPLPWHYHYPRRDDAPDLAARIGFAELIGPRGPLIADGSRVGFTLMAPHTFYPLHRHPAVELYVVMAGTAAWIAPPVEQVVPPGGMVLHPMNQPHAMRTAAEPLLALYAWHGEIDTPATYLDDR